MCDLRTHYETSSHFARYKTDTVVFNKKIYFLTAIFHTAVVTETREKDRMKYISCYTETLKVSFVGDKRSKHRLHYFTSSPKQGRSSLGPESVRPTATLSDRPDWLNKLTALLYISLSYILYLIYIIIL